MLFNDQVGRALSRGERHKRKNFGGSIDRYISMMQEAQGCKPVKKQKTAPAIKVLDGGCLLIVPNWARSMKR